MADTQMTRPGRGFLSSWTRDPYAALRQEMDDLVGRFMGEDGPLAGFGGAPTLDLSETDTEVRVQMDLPGVKAEEIDIQLNANILTVSGERKEEQEEKGRTYHRVERRSGKFSRSVALPCSVEEEEVAAEFHDGTLTVTLPKSEKAKTRKINVKS